MDFRVRLKVWDVLLRQYRQLPLQCLHPRRMVDYRGTSFIRNAPPPQDHGRALGTVLL